MKLCDYLVQLSYAELGNLRVGKDGTGNGIKPEKIPYVVNCINEALLRLYSRFVLKTNSVMIECNEVRTRYHLNSKHSWLNATEEDKANPEFCDKYIVDDPEHPFTNDIIKILNVTSSEGITVPLNNHVSPISVFTPVFDVLEVPLAVPGVVLTVVYQAKHIHLDFGKNPEQELNVPESLLGALSSYVAYLVYSNMNTQEAVANAQKYLANYQAIIQENIDMDLVHASYSQDNTKFRMNGWM